ncbi:MAG: histidine phosphatase family protein, partial [Gammaproteobacteria bacterium]
MKHAVHDTLTPPDAHAQQNSPIPVEQHTKTRVIIARHGNTFDHGDEVRRVGRHTDLPLSSSGQKQAQQLGLHLLTLTDETHTSAQCVSPLVAVYTSSLQRTQETARIALTTAGIEIPPTPSTDFDEIDYGPDENQPETVVEKRLGKATLAA